MLYSCSICSKHRLQSSPEGEKCERAHSAFRCDLLVVLLPLFSLQFSSGERMLLILIVADCNFQKQPQQYFWSYMLFQDFATSHQEVKSICRICKLVHKWQQDLYLVLSLSRYPPLEASHHVLRKLRLHGEATCWCSGPQSHQHPPQGPGIATINAQTCE